MTTFFTADTHFNHKNIMRFSGRPYDTVENMNEDLIAKWNEKVRQFDTVYHLGDFAFGSEEKAQNIFDRLNGKKHLIIGNHEKAGLRLEGWESVQHYKRIKHGKQDIILCHYAMRVWEKSHYGSWMLYGHSHGSLVDDPHALSIDVGVDCHSYRPISFSEIDRIMRKKKYKPVDHHKREK